MSTNCHFPLIEYLKNKTPYEWGKYHGEEYRTPIKELANIRKELMLSKNPRLLKKLDELAHSQFEISKKFSPSVALEIEGIVKGSNLTLTEIVILNNYTDFRDIELPEEGCSTIHLNSLNGEVLSGQTWDMHRSAKNYMCLLKIPRTNNNDSQMILTLVGCVGLMGINSQNALIGVNNINTKNAKTGLIWPLLVRQTILNSKTLFEMHQMLTNAPVTSGHNYLISTQEGGEHLEITPTQYEKVGSISKNKTGAIFHTNHCIGNEIKKNEDQSSMSSTTHNRFNLISNKIDKVVHFNEFKSLLQDHTEYPKSICSHFENGSQDPSFTCGGGLGNLTTGEYCFYRGCPTHDSDYKEYHFKIINGDFVKTFSK